jgi:hypothetical protein
VFEGEEWCGCVGSITYGGVCVVGG